ncbi:orf50 [Alcelaphine gammaherpesvirus 2]|uniref:Orf50 n=1 Tax=Alcelaphine gammaherpesvirus 2 TaxID=138184 RepID=A0A068AAM0_9GAMA|nr:orf50 [Alcelaphine gammaherpesvirus 2]AIA62085.1 orf50 [Alcelaphine gammaherpesvirus 2]
MDIRYDLSEKIAIALRNFQQNMACTADQSEEFTKDVHTLCQEIVEENKVRNELHGLVADMNLLNLFTLFRSYKQRIRSQSGKPLLCATASSQVVRFFLERVIVHTDKWFLLAPCNGLVLPPQLARAMYVLLSEVRGKATNYGRMFNGGRKIIMKAAKEVVSVYSALSDRGEISPEMRAYMGHIFSVPDIERVFRPLFKIECDIAEGKTVTTHSMLFAPRRRCPSKTVFSQTDPKKRYPLPEVLFDAHEPQTAMAYGRPELPLLQDTSMAQESPNGEDGPCCSKEVDQYLPTSQSGNIPSPPSPSSSDTESCDSRSRPASTNPNTMDDDDGDVTQGSEDMQQSTSDEDQDSPIVVNNSIFYIDASTQQGFFSEQQPSASFASYVNPAAAPLDMYQASATGQSFSAPAYSQHGTTGASMQPQYYPQGYGHEDGSDMGSYGYTGSHLEALVTSSTMDTGGYTAGPVTAGPNTGLQWTTVFPPTSSSTVSSSGADSFGSFSYPSTSATACLEDGTLAPSTPCLLDELLDGDNEQVGDESLIMQHAMAPMGAEPGGQSQEMPVAPQQEATGDPLSDQIREIYDFFSSVNPTK